MKPIKIGTISHPSIRVDYLDDWGPGMIDSVGAVPDSVLAAIEPVLARAGWELEDRIGQHSHDITVVNGAAFSHTDSDYGTVAIALVDYPLKAKTELITRHGGMEMRLGDVVIFDSDQWHAWIAHGPCALAALCVRPLPTPPPPGGSEMSRTIKVRIAVAVDPTGEWASGGFSNAAPNTAMDIAIECLQPGERRYWLEAELEVPEVQTITVQPTTTEDPK